MSLRGASWNLISRWLAALDAKMPLVGAAGGRQDLLPSHVVPPDDAGVTDTMWREAALRHLRETVIVGRNLLEV